MDSPIGELVLASSEKGLAAVLLPGKGKHRQRLKKLYPRMEFEEAAGPNRHAAEQLKAYFAGNRTTFDLKLDLRGTPFQIQAWGAVRKVPYGETRSYGDIARIIGKPNAHRAVGRANKMNPIPIVIPCHRIIGSDGSMTGYGGGIPLKDQLIRMERRITA